PTECPTIREEHRLPVMVGGCSPPFPLTWRSIMKRSFLGIFIIGGFLTLIATILAANDVKEAAIKKDRKQIEGNWRVTGPEVNGKKAMDEDAKKFTVVNGSDGT